MPDSVHRDILNNALDYLLHSLRAPVDEPDEEAKDILPKYLVLNLVAGIELVFKARLCKKDWSLIFQNREKATLETLRSGDFCSATFDACVERLNRECGIPFGTQTRDSLRALRARRNCYQHLRLTPEPEAVAPLAARCLDLILDLLESLFDESDFDDNGKEALDAIRTRLSDFSSLRQQRLARLAGKLKDLLDAGRVARCIVCGEHSLELSSINKCLFCCWEASAQEVANAVAAEEEGHRIAAIHQQFLFPMPPFPYVRVKSCEECSCTAVVARTSDEVGSQFVSSVCYACGSRRGSDAAEHMKD